MAKRIFRPKPGGVDPSAPHWRGDTAEAIILERRERVRASRRDGSKRSTRSRSRTKRASVPEGLEADLKTLRRLERVLPKRKTLAARQRLAKRIEALKRDLGLED